MDPLPGSPEPPAGLRASYANWTWHLAYQYDVLTLTYRLSSSTGDVRFLKLAPVTHHPSLNEEAVRMAWASDHLPVPPVVDHGCDGALAWLVTRGLAGVDATDPMMKNDPETLVPLLAAGLRQFHAAPIGECPFDFRLPAALDHVRSRLERGLIDPARDFHPEFAHLSAPEAVSLLHSSQPSSESLVVCHGDYCLPNVLIRDAEVAGFIDLGELAVADRWWDLAVATWSLSWNLGPGYEDLFLREYGVERDAARIAFYRLLYDLAS